MPPVLFIAFATAFVLSLPVLIGRPGVQVICAQNCCGAVTVSLLGILPVRLVLRQGGTVGPGLGFVIPLLGVFMGGILGAIIQVAWAPVSPSELRDSANAMYEQWVEGVKQEGGTTADLRREDFVGMVLFCGRYGVLLVAAGSAVCAGAVGLVTATLVRRLANARAAASGSAGGDAEDDAGDDAADEDSGSE